MNKENAHKFLPLVQALADGKTIQHIGPDDKWHDCNPCYFNIPPEHYRIKPEPRTWSVWVHESGNDILASIPTAWNQENSWKRITVQEVLE
jgi:hypothetical protein